MSGKKVKQSNEDLINEPKIVVLPSLTSYSYGQTPAALCRQHFHEIAERLNVTVEELGKDVLNRSLGDQLCMLRDFYKSKNAESEAIYEPLVDLCSKAKDTPKTDEKVPSKKRKTERIINVPAKKNVSRVLVLSSESDESEDKVEKTIEKPKKLPAKKPQKNKTLSRIQLSIEETIAGPNPVLSNTNMKCQLTEKEPEKLENLQDHNTNNGPIEVEKAAKETHQSILPVCEKTTESTKEPASAIIAETGNTAKEAVEDEMEIFLYGKSPPKPKAPPKKKHQRFPSQPTNAITKDRNVKASPSTACKSPPPSDFSIPGLTFESQSWSPSRQRDLLSIARDIAVLQKSIASGEKPHDSVSDLISFTKPTN